MFLAINIAEKSTEKSKWYGAHKIYLQVGGTAMTYGFILRFRAQEKLNSANELLKEKSSSFTLKKLFSPANVLHRFTLVIECSEQDMIEVLENYFLIFHLDNIDISLLHGHESEIDKLMPI